MIKNSELFADLQETLTEIFLIELLGDLSPEIQDRLKGNHQIKEVIKNIMRDRFSYNDIINFLENGYPRQVDLGRII